MSFIRFENPIPDLSDRELKAIKSLEKLARSWPPTIGLFSRSGKLCVVDLRPDGQFHVEDFNQSILCTVDNIPNDGGDPE